MDRKRERVVLETGRHRVEGEVMLSSEGYKSRLSDHLNEPAREFLIVLDAVLTPFDNPDGAYRSGVVMLQRQRIEMVLPANEIGSAA